MHLHTALDISSLSLSTAPIPDHPLKKQNKTKKALMTERRVEAINPKLFHGYSETLVHKCKSTDQYWKVG